MTDTQKKVMDALDRFVDKVLAYDPKKKTIGNCETGPHGVEEVESKKDMQLTSRRLQKRKK